MSWVIGMSIGHSFVEITAQQARRKIHERWFMPSVPLGKGLDNFIQKNPELQGAHLIITTKLAQTIMQKRVGNPIGLLVTAGFENWPHIRQPIPEENLSLDPHRRISFLSSDLIFGMEERTNAKGVVEKSVAFSDLEFLAPKLEMLETKQVAVGFLHSNKNPENERSVASFLRDKGFEVLCSHEIEESNNEVARWWRAVLNAYVAPAFHDLEKEIAPVKEKYQLQVRYWSSDGSLFEMEPKKYFSSAFGNVAALKALAKKKKAKTVLHLGLEGFLVIRADGESHIYQSDYGPVAIPAPDFVTLPVQPTSLIESRGFAGPYLGPKEAGFEPGTMMMGRSFQPTFIDCLFAAGLLPEIPGVQSLLAPEVQKKITETLFAIGRNAGVPGGDLAKFIVDNAAQRIAFAVRRMNLEDPLLVTGALATPLGTMVEEHLPGRKWVSGDYRWGGSEGTATGKFDAED